MISEELLKAVLPNLKCSHCDNGFIYKDYGNDGAEYNMCDKCNGTGIGNTKDINIYELALRTRDYFKTKNKHLSLNQSIEDIFKEANNIYKRL